MSIFKPLLGGLFSVLLLLAAGCADPNITFPQAPTSGAGGLTLGNTKIFVEGTATSELVVQFEPTSRTYRFFWNRPPNLNCLSYRILLTHGPIPTTTQAFEITTSRTVFDGLASSFYGDAPLTDFISSQLSSLSAFAVCTPDNLANGSGPFPRSNFVSLFGL